MDENIISAFSDGVRDVKMKEELAIHEDLCTSLELFNLATKCARSKEGRLSHPRAPAPKLRSFPPPPHTGVGYYTTTVARTSINLVSLMLFNI